MPGPEQVLVFGAGVLEGRGGLQGFSPEVGRWLGAVLSPGVSRFLPRDEVEDDPNFKQIIPYLVLSFGDRVWRYRRGKRGTEARLHAKLSLGLGGLVNPGDETLFSLGPAAYGRAWRRELGEEVDIQGGFRHRVVGLLHDGRDPVGRVHFGVVHHLRLTRPEVRSREAAITRGELVTLDRVRAEADRLETWSQLLLPHLPGWLAGDGGAP